jgi:hypothetical protein
MNRKPEQRDGEQVVSISISCVTHAMQFDCARLIAPKTNEESRSDIVNSKNKDEWHRIAASQTSFETTP